MKGKKRKLLFITWTHSAGGGAEKVLTTLVNNLDEQKYDIAIQEVAGFTVKKEPLNKNIHLLPPLYRDADCDYKCKVLQHVLAQKPHILRALYNLDDYDVIITWNYQLPSFMLPAFPDKQTIGWFHGAIDDLNPDVHTEENPVVITLKNALQRRAWGFADRIVTISNKSLQSLRDIFPEYEAKAQIVNNAFDAVSTVCKAAEVVEDTYVHDTCPVIACIGRLEERKNFSLVIEALAQLHAEKLECTLLIIGEGEERERLERLAKKLGVEESVRFLGYKSNPLPYLKEADILCVSSLAEGFPTVVLEAMALGKPFVTTAVAGASQELSCDGTCGLVADWEACDYAEKIKTLLTDRSLYERMSANCIKKVKEFSVERTVRCFDELIASLPEKTDTVCIQTISKEQAAKKIRRMYLWSPQFLVLRLYRSLCGFFIRPGMRNFCIVGYYALCSLLYLPSLPLRFFTKLTLLKVKGDKLL